MSTKPLSRSLFEAAHFIRSRTLLGFQIAFVVLILLVAGCASPPATREPSPAPAAKEAVHETADIRVRLVGVLRAGDPATLVKDPGWLEYLLVVENRSTRALTVRNVKLLSREGRYLDSASSYDQIIVPPDTATKIAGSVATRAASATAGQLIPYGGSIAGIVSSAISASAAESAAHARREMDVRKLKDVELAPSGRITGSAFLPRESGAKALVLDYSRGERMNRLEIPLR